MNEVDGPVYLHWLGAVFNTLMANYWGHEDIGTAADKTVIPLMEKHKAKIRGIKLSTLDTCLERYIREKISEFDQRVFTGDDFNFQELIAGDANGYGHALLGIFGGTAQVAAKALEYLAHGDLEKYDMLMTPLVELSRHIFEAPT